MKSRRIIPCILSFVLVFALTPIMTANAADNKVAADFTSGYGDTKVNLTAGFDFINNSSSDCNWDLALTALTLSGQVYDDNATKSLLLDLGYDYANYNKEDGSDFLHPVACFGYRRLETGANGANIFAIVVRGTKDLNPDLGTDAWDGITTMFDQSKGAVMADFEKFIDDEVPGKTVDELKNEDNYFLIAGHSLGGAVANCLSVDGEIVELAGDKGNIYTYTFESPHTCINYWWMDPEGMSNAFNFKDSDDWVTHQSPKAGSTTYGKDLNFDVNENDFWGIPTLDDTTFRALFPNAKGGSVYEAPKPENFGDVFGHHDRGLDLVYIVQNGISNGVWGSVDDVIASDEGEIEPSEAEPDDASSIDEHDIDSGNFSLIGTWVTPQGDTIMDFSGDGTYTVEWKSFGGFTEEGAWSADSMAGESFPIEMDGLGILQLMQLFYGGVSSDYHFEILKNGEDGVYLVQVYGDYTAQSSPCKLPLQRQ